jgi:hypothetical protein
MGVENFCVSEITSSSVTLIWDQIDYADGYVIYSYDPILQTYEKVKRIGDAKTTEANISRLKSNNEYKFIIESFDDAGQGIRYSESSRPLTVFTNNSSSSIDRTNSKVSKGYFADISHSNIEINGNVFTTHNTETMTYEPDEYDLLITCSHGDYGRVSEIAHFFDYKGYYTVVYKSNNYIFFDRYDADLKKISTIKIKMKYYLLGDALTDKEGNYYIVWGKEDDSINGGVVTMAVSKYSYSGKHIATTTYKTNGGIESWDTRHPFEAGNCDTIIDSKGILICNYSREMYNGHQSNDIICVDTSTMKTVKKYNNYVSHSFDQRVFELSDGDICFVNKGDAYPRAFSVEKLGSKRERYELFHFYGEQGDNYIYAWLGGAVEVSGNIFLVGSSAKSMTSACKKEGQNLFTQLVDDNRIIKGSEIRKGKSNGVSYIDKGVKWLTNYGDDYTVANPQVVKIDKECFVILWEKMKVLSYDKYDFVQSYYMILSADGTILQRETPMNKTRLTSFEDPIYDDGYIYWTTAGRIEKTEVEIEPYYYMLGYRIADGDKGIIHKLKVGSVVNKLPTPKVISVKNVSEGVTVTWEPVIGTDKYRVLRKTPDGEWKKVKDTTATIFTDKTAENSKEYLYTVKCVSSNGKKNLSDYDKTGVKIYRLQPTTVKVQAKQKTVTLTWNKISKSTGYEIEYTTDKNFKKNVETVTLKGASKTSQSVKSLSAGKIYYFRARSYKKLSGKMYYAAWSKTAKIKISG